MAVRAQRERYGLIAPPGARSRPRPAPALDVSISTALSRAARRRAQHARAASTRGSARVEMRRDLDVFAVPVDTIRDVTRQLGSSELVDDLNARVLGRDSSDRAQLGVIEHNGVEGGKNHSPTVLAVPGLLHDDACGGSDLRALNFLHY